MLLCGWDIDFLFDFLELFIDFLLFFLTFSKQFKFLYFVCVVGTSFSFFELHFFFNLNSRFALGGVKTFAGPRERRSDGAQWLLAFGMAQT